jgi:ubiquinone/menaquinone biosynthesis C-methylase UbiE
MHERSEASVYRAAMSDEKNIAGWESIAERYQRERGWPSEDLCWGHRVAPERELRLLGDLRGKRALVLGCGGGQDVIALARLGAARVTGVDFSKTQLAHAKDNLARAKVEATLIESSVSELAMLADESFDVVVSVHVMSYVERVEACFAEARRVLAAGGVFAFSTQHPIDCSTSDAPPYTFTKSYFQIETNEEWTSLGGKGAPFRRNHHTVADYFRYLQNARFTIEAMLEPRPTNDVVWSGTETEYFDKLAVVPGTLIFKARK